MTTAEAITTTCRVRRSALCKLGGGIHAVAPNDFHVSSFAAIERSHRLLGSNFGTLGVVWIHGTLSDLALCVQHHLVAHVVRRGRVPRQPVLAAHVVNFGVLVIHASPLDFRCRQRDPPLQRNP